MMMHRVLCIGLCFAVLGLCGCASRNAERPLYSTPVPDQNRDTAKAQKLTETAADLLERGDLARAESLLRQALTADVGYGPAHNNLGIVYLRRSQLYMAAWEFEYASRLMPHRPEPRHNLGLVFEQAGRLDEAVRWYEEARDLERDNPLLLGSLVRSRVRRGDSGPELHALLEELVLKADSGEWRTWAREWVIRVRPPS
jgi:Tfp pilus assembly protein PilF